MVSLKSVTVAVLPYLAMAASPVLAQELPTKPPDDIAPNDPARPPITIRCPNGHNFRLATGSELGACKVYAERGRVIGGFCTDGSNSARQTCATGCKEVTGSGSCEAVDPSQSAGPS